MGCLLPRQDMRSTVVEVSCMLQQFRNTCKAKLGCQICPDVLRQTEWAVRSNDDNTYSLVKLLSTRLRSGCSGWEGTSIKRTTTSSKIWKYCRAFDHRHQHVQQQRCCSETKKGFHFQGGPRKLFNQMEWKTLSSRGSFYSPLLTYISSVVMHLLWLRGDQRSIDESFHLVLSNSHFMGFNWTDKKTNRCGHTEDTER